MDRDVVDAFKEFDRRIRQIEQRLQFADPDQTKSRTDIVTMLHKSSTNALFVRVMFILEILRQRGLLDDIDLSEIEAKVKSKHATGQIPWGASEKTALSNIRETLKEIEGDYDWEDPSDALPQR